MYIKLQQQHYEDRQRIIKEAKENGTWIGGLDGNEELFAESNRILKEKIELLKSMVDEEVTSQKVSE